MRNFPQSGKSGGGQDEEIVYEEIVRPPFPPSGAPRPPFGRFAPPPPPDSGESVAVAERDASVSPPAPPEIRPAANLPKPKPFVKAADFRRAAPAKAAPNDRRSGGTNAFKCFRFALAAAVFAGLCVGIFYAFKSNP